MSHSIIKMNNQNIRERAIVKEQALRGYCRPDCFIIRKTDQRYANNTTKN